MISDHARFWERIRQCRDDFDQIKNQQDWMFVDWLVAEYGIQLQTQQTSGHIEVNRYDIVDEQRYMIFLLKYGA